MGGQPFKMAEVAPACCNHQSAFFLYDSYWTADRGVFRYLFHPTGRVLNFLTPQSRVLKNVRICMFYPNICIVFIKTDRFGLQFKVIYREILNF